MPIISVPYTNISFSQMLKAIRWCQNALNLRDWTIDLEFGDTVPEWVKDDSPEGLGYSQPFTPYFSARMWVCPSRCKKDNIHPVVTVCHEMLHIFFWNYRICDRHDERMINTLDYHLFQSWLREQKRLKRRK